MTRYAVVIAVAAALVAGCRTAPPTPVAASPHPTATPTVEETRAIATQDALQGVRDDVDALLLVAGNAAAGDDPEEFHDCEALVYEKLSPVELHPDSEDFATYVADVLDGIRLEDQNRSMFRIKMVGANHFHSASFH